MLERTDTHRDYSLYCFDLDDTLVDTFHHVANVLYPRLAERAALDAPEPEQLRRYWGGPLDASLGMLFPDAADPRFLISVLRELHFEYPVPAVANAVHILNVLRRHGHHFALFTSGDPEIAAFTARTSLGLRNEDISSFYFLARMSERKDTPGILDRIRNEVRDKSGMLIPSEETLVVGDDPRDGKLARLGNADFLGLTSGPFGSEDFESAGFPEECVRPDLTTAFSAPTDHGVVAIIRDRVGRFLLIQEARADHPYAGAWSGPHGSCRADDVLEAETVVRESREESGVEVRAIKRLYTRAADTKVRTVTFWLAELRDDSPLPRVACAREVEDVRWFGIEEILSGDISLYPGTLDFFRRFHTDLGRLAG